MCKACPENTDLDTVAASECQCLTGYFRNTEGLTDVCPADQTFEGSMIKCTSKQIKKQCIIPYNQLWFSIITKPVTKCTSKMAVCYIVYVHVPTIGFACAHVHTY